MNPESQTYTYDIRYRFPFEIFIAFLHWLTPVVPVIRDER
jgi:hypothetical protein